MLFKILCQHHLRLKSPAWEGKCVQHFPRHWSRPLAHSSRLCLWVILPFSCSMGDKILSRIQLSYPQALTQGWGADIPSVFQVQTQWNQILSRPGGGVSSAADEPDQPVLNVVPSPASVMILGSCLTKSLTEKLNSKNILIFLEENGKWKMGFNYLENKRGNFTHQCHT